MEPETLVDVVAHRDALFAQVWVLSEFLLAEFPNEWHEYETACKAAIGLLKKYKQAGKP